MSISGVNGSLKDDTRDRFDSAAVSASLTEESAPTNSLFQSSSSLGIGVEMAGAPE
jgi:hypothetical protein